MNGRSVIREDKEVNWKTGRIIWRAPYMTKSIASEKDHRRMESWYPPAVFVKCKLLLLSLDIQYWYRHSRASSVAVTWMLQMLHLRSEEMSLRLKGLQGFHPNNRAGHVLLVQDIQYLTCFKCLQITEVYRGMWKAAWKGECKITIGGVNNGSRSIVRGRESKLALFPKRICPRPSSMCTKQVYAFHFASSTFKAPAFIQNCTFTPRCFSPIHPNRKPEWHSNSITA